MATAPIVTASGCLLSSLFYEHVNSYGDQEGFLLGEVLSHITDTISDSQMCAEKEETSLNIYTNVPCEEAFSFYDNRGHIQQDRLDSYLQGRQKEVVGWYRFRRNSSLDVSLREHTVHSNLCRALSSTYDKFFIFGLFTCSTSTNESTHSYDHVFLRSTGLKFEPLALNIINLGDTSHSEYRLYPHAAVNIHSGHFSKVMSSAGVVGDSLGPVSQVQEIHSALQEKLEGLQEQVGDSEAIVASMALEVDDLETRLASIQSLSGALTPDTDGPDIEDNSEDGILTSESETEASSSVKENTKQRRKKGSQESKKNNKKESAKLLEKAPQEIIRDFDSGDLSSKKNKGSPVTKRKGRDKSPVT